MNIEQKIDKVENEVEKAERDIDHSWAWEMLQMTKRINTWLCSIIIALIVVVVGQYCLYTYERLQYEYTTSIEATGVYAAGNSNLVTSQDVSEETWKLFLEYMEWLDGNSQSDEN